MVKIIIFILVAAGGFFLYTDGMRPYFDAVNETEEILRDAGVPYDKRNAKEYRNKAMEMLKTQCKHGVKEVGIYDYRCSSDAKISFFE